MSSPPAVTAALPEPSDAAEATPNSPSAATHNISETKKEGFQSSSQTDEEAAPSSPKIATSPTQARADVDGLISSLRASLASSQSLLSTQATRLSDLSDLEETHRQLKDQYAFLAAAKDAVEAQLREEVKRREEADERVEALRGQVEMARRGVMTLQKQEKDRKRMSMMGPPTLPASAGLGLQTGAAGSGEEMLESSDKDKEREEKLNRRTSMMGRGFGHRRVSSNSEPDASLSTLLGGGGAKGDAPTLSASPSFTTGPSVAAPTRPGLRELRLGAGATSPNPAQLPSPVSFDDPYASTPAHRTSLSPPLAGTSGSPSKALASERAETERLRTELAATNLRLAESEEARQASETVLRALREFISGGAGLSPGSEGQGQGGRGVVDLNDPLTMEELKGMSLPPLPTDRDPDEPLAHPSQPAEQSRKTSGGAGTWGFKLWNAKLAPPTPASPAPSSQVVEPPATPHVVSPPGSVISHSTPRASPLPNPHGELPLNEAAVDRVPAQTPLASFVSSWTKSVPPGTPAPAQSSGTSASASTPSVQPPAGATRSFSSFFRKATVPATPSAPSTKEKDLPAHPASSEAGSVGAERAADSTSFGSQSPIVEQEEHAHEDHSPQPTAAVPAAGGLEPSPVILDTATVPAPGGSEAEARDEDRQDAKGGGVGDVDAEAQSSPKKD